MQRQSLRLTKQGIFIAHWAIELMAGILLFLIVSGMLIGSQPNLALPMLRVSGFLNTWIYPCLQIALIIGVMLTMAAPKSSGVAPWGIACLSLTIVANLWPAIVYWFDLPLRWLGSSGVGIVPIVQAIFFTAMLLQLARWVLKTERSDSQNHEKDRLDVQNWSSTVSGLNTLLISSLIFLAILCGLAFVPSFQMLIFRLLGMSAFILPLLGLFGALILLAQFSRQVYRVNRLLRTSGNETAGADAIWDQIPADSLRPSIVLPAILALASFGAYQAASYWLAPEYMKRQLAKMKLDFPMISTNPATPDASIGTPAPNLTLKTLAGAEIQLETLKGKTVVLNFWATWCPPCVAEMPDLQKLSVDLADQNTVVIGISGEPEDTLKRFVDSNGITFHIVSGSGLPSPFDNIRAIPTTFIIDPQGIIQERHLGSRSYNQFRSAIDKATGATGNQSTEPSH